MTMRAEEKRILIFDGVQKHGLAEKVIGIELTAMTKEDATNNLDSNHVIFKYF